MNDDLILDIGVHKGKDSAFYLQKGFRVVGVEASPDLCDLVRTRLAAPIASGKMTLLQKALSYRSGETVSFFLNPAKDDWGSLTKGEAEKGMGNSVEIKVETISLADIFAQTGAPYYIKCDIEGGDAIFVRALLTTAVRPTYVSFELTSVDDMAFIKAAGYQEFQIVNQWMHPFVIPPDPAREGRYFNTRFDGETSGLFGRELPEDKWTSYAEVVRQFLLWSRLRNLNDQLAIGWLDLHARGHTPPR